MKTSENKPKTNWNHFESLKNLGKSEFLRIKDQVPPFGASSISFLIQNGPAKQVGENGLIPDVIGRVWQGILLDSQDNNPDTETDEAIKHIGRALSLLEQRFKRITSENIDKEMG